MSGIVGTLISNPDMDAYAMKGHTPRGAGRLVVAEGVRFQKLSTNVEAFACAHLTQMGVPGQQTGRVNRTQERSGADVSSFEIEHHDLGGITLQGVNGHPNLAFLEQPGGQHLLFGLCYVCQEHDLIDNVFPVGVGHFCCVDCFNGLVNAYGEANRASRRHQRAREYEQWMHLQNPVVVTSEMRRHIFARDGHACRYCGSTDQLSIDHLFPQSRGGSHREDNLVVSCMPCNTQKGARTPEEAGMTLRQLDGQA